MSNMYEGLGTPANSVGHQHYENTIQRNFILRCKRRQRKLVQNMEVLQRGPDEERIPDLSYWDVVKKRTDGEIEYSKLLLTIEITHTAANDEYSHKSIAEVFQKVSTIKESFIYNYELDRWTRFTPAKNRKPIEEEGVSYSEVIGMDLNELLTW